MHCVRWRAKASVRWTVKGHRQDYPSQGGRRGHGDEDITAATREDAQRLLEMFEQEYGLFGDVWEDND